MIAGDMPVAVTKRLFRRPRMRACNINHRHSHAIRIGIPLLLEPAAILDNQQIPEWDHRRQPRADLDYLSPGRDILPGRADYGEGFHRLSMTNWEVRA